MMTENTWTEENILASDVWRAEKNPTPMTPEEEVEAWRKTTRILDNLCGMADALLLDPLILALGDAPHRACEERQRAEDRLSKPEGAKLSPREERRLMGLLRCSDAFSVALDRVERAEPPTPTRLTTSRRSERSTRRRTSSSYATGTRLASPARPGSAPSRRDPTGPGCNRLGPPFVLRVRARALSDAD